MECTFCNKEAKLKTECCSLAYCGQECLSNDLNNHNLVCIEAKRKSLFQKKKQQPNPFGRRPARPYQVTYAKPDPQRRKAWAQPNLNPSSYRKTQDGDNDDEMIIVDKTQVTRKQFGEIKFSK